MGVKVTVKTNAAAWKDKVEKASDFAAAALAEQMMNDSLDIIPKQEGTLRDGFIEKPETGRRDLVWDAPYALYQWYGMWPDGSHQVRNYTTPGTDKMWVEQAKSQNGDKWGKVVQNAFTEGMK